MNVTSTANNKFITEVDIIKQVAENLTINLFNKHICVHLNYVCKSWRVSMPLKRKFREVFEPTDHERQLALVVGGFEDCHWWNGEGTPTNTAGRLTALALFINMLEAGDI